MQLDLATQLQIFSTRFLGIFIEAVSFLLLGSLVSGLIEVFLSKDALTRLVPRHPVRATIVGSMLGFAFPVCECGVVPVARRLYQKGLPVSVGITFLLAAPVMNPIVLASTYAAFGWGPVLIGRYVITWIMAMSVGLLFSLQTRPQKMLRAQGLATIAGASGVPELADSGETSLAVPAKRPPFWPGLRQALRFASDDFFGMAHYLVIGTVLAASMQTFIPQDQFKAVAAHPVLSVLAMSALAFILSLCSTTDAILALSFANPLGGAGFTTGSILTFLTFGPMVDIKSTLMYLGIFRRRTVAYMVILPLLISVLIGIWLNLNVRF